MTRLGITGTLAALLLSVSAPALAADLVSPADDAVSEFLNPIKTFRWQIPAGEQAYAIEIGHAALPAEGAAFAKGT